MHCPACGATVQTFRNPAPTVDIIIETEGGVVLIERKNPPHGWALPGGFVDYGECYEDAARREAEEESGLRIGAVEFLCLSEQILVEERQHWVSLIYVTEDVSGEARVVEPEKLPEFGWFPLDALPAPLSRFAADAVEALRRR